MNLKPTLENNLNKLFQLIPPSSNIHIVGTSGAEGAAITLFLKQYEYKFLTLHDFCTNAQSFTHSFLQSHSKQSPQETKKKLNELLQLKNHTHFKNSYLKNIQEADVIFVPQSWFLHPVNDPIKKYKHKILTITELYLRLAPCKTVAITGSNGKSTTTDLVYSLLKTKNAIISGNDRSSHQVLNNLLNFKPNNILVLETSNRQLFNLKKAKSDIAVLLNITENHLLEHKNFTEYKNSKAQITKDQTSKDILIFNFDDKHCTAIAKKSQASTISFGKEKDNICHFDTDNLYYKNKPLLKIQQIKLQGIHNLYNICAAVMVAKIFKVSNKTITTILKSYTGLPQRNETVFEKNGLKVVDDRQGTAVNATIEAIKSHPKPLFIILGGQNKKMPLQKLITTLNQKNITTIGIKSPFVDELQNKVINLKVATTLTSAIKMTLNLVKKNNKIGTILFSPACEYGPYFKQTKSPHYEQFKEITLKNLKTML